MEISITLSHWFWGGSQTTSLSLSLSLSNTLVVALANAIGCHRLLLLMVSYRSLVSKKNSGLQLRPTKIFARTVCDHPSQSHCQYAGPSVLEAKRVAAAKSWMQGATALSGQLGQKFDRLRAPPAKTFRPQALERSNAGLMNFIINSIIINSCFQDVL